MRTEASKATEASKETKTSKATEASKETEASKATKTSKHGRHRLWPYFHMLTVGIRQIVVKIKNRIRENFLKLVRKK